jgi:hypothetical protein
MARGPVPKRTEMRRRVNKPDVPITKATAGRVVVPPSSDDWHPVARAWYESLALSGQSAFYEQSDWEQARVWTELLSHTLSSGKPSAMLVAAWSSGAAELLTTEGARRRARLELERDTSDSGEEHSSATVSDLTSRLHA